MLNQVIILGRLTKDPELKELENGSKVCNLTLAVTRSYKNTKGEYETDFIDCTIWDSVASNITEYCKKGDIIGVKGRLETSFSKDNKIKYTKIIGEKVTFVSLYKGESK